MELEQAIAEFGLGESGEVLRLEWQASQQSLPEGDLFFLDGEFLSEACRAAHLDEEVGEVVGAAARRVAANPAARVASAWPVASVSSLNFSASASVWTR